MIRQPSFSEIETLAKAKRTRRAQFLDDMNAIVPWDPLIALIEPFYPKGTRRPTIRRFFINSLALIFFVNRFPMNRLF